MAGSPNRLSCRGRGGWRDAFGWHRCPCTRPSKAAQEALRKANARDNRPFQLALAGMSDQVCTCEASNFNECKVHGY